MARNHYETESGRSRAFRMLDDGATKLEIVQALGLTPKTVDSYMYLYDVDDSTHPERGVARCGRCSLALLHPVHGTPMEHVCLAGDATARRGEPEGATHNARNGVKSGAV